MISKVFRQIASLGLAEGFGRVLAFVFSAAVARSQGLEVLGYISLGLSMIAYITIAGDSGLNQDSTRQILAGRSVYHVVQESVRMQLAAVLGASVVVGIISYALYGWPFFWYFLALLPIPIISSLSTPYILDSSRRIGELAFSRVILSAVTASVGMCMLYFGAVDGALAFAYVCGYFGAMLFVVWRSRAPLFAALRRIEPARFKERAKVYQRLGVAGLLLHVFVSLPIVVSGLSSPDALGDMGVVTRIWFLLSAPAAMAGSVLIPFLSTRVGAKRVPQLAALAAILGLVGWLPIYFFSAGILKVLFGVDAAVAGPALGIFAAALPMIGVVSVMSAALISVHQEKQISAAYIIGTLVFSAYCIWWRTELSSVDLSAAWTVSYFAVAVYLLCVYFSLRPETTNRVS
nr:hypothetical protein [uncultured Rhodococcus sp.]